MRRPLYALAVVLTLALAIGANTAVFSLFKTVLLRHHPELAQTGLAQVTTAFYPWE